MKKLGILLIRGSGSLSHQRQEKFLEKLWPELSKRGINSNEIATQFLEWQAVLEIHQRRLVDRMFEDDVRVKSKLIRKLVMLNIADLINYGGRPNNPSDVYTEVHEKINFDIKRLQAKLPENTPIIILASSMGTEVIQNHIWDRQKHRDLFAGESEFECLETLVGMFTMGNNLPLFAAALPANELCPIRFPGNVLPEELKERAKWANIFDKNDPFGFPIKFINEAYQAANVEDKEMNVGSFLTSWNLISHLEYWTSKKVRRYIADFIAQIWPHLEKEPSEPPEIVIT